MWKGLNRAEIVTKADLSDDLFPVNIAPQARFVQTIELKRIYRGESVWKGLKRAEIVTGQIYPIMYFL